MVNYMYAACYSADFYCENTFSENKQLSLEHKFPEQYSGRYGPQPAQFTGSNKRDTFRQARKAGWLIKGDECWCRGCVEDMKASKRLTSSKL